ncbi:MAG: putative oxidoreductase C-terminal domain-containing protein [Planctomycetota bacterium]|jgi:predicted dehydrogenase
MTRKVFLAVTIAVLLFVQTSCGRKDATRKKFSGAAGEVKLMTLDPGHFHAALVQKTMYDQISPMVFVYAPEGPDVVDHLNRVVGFNTRSDSPTSWDEKLYTGGDFLEKMVADKPGNVVVISGNNRKKAEYIKACVDAGLNVLADKPMCIDAKGFKLIEEAFSSAARNGVLLYDIMTERSEITSILQRELARNKGLFGELEAGTADNPAVINESVHHFFKYVAGNPIKRPGWYFDTTQQGEGIVDVTTHLVDLVMWGCRPEEAIDREKDVEVIYGKRWPTMISLQEYSKVTRLTDFPDFLKSRLDERGLLPCYANGEIVFKIKGVHAKVAVTWNFQAPEGTKDTHYSMMRGSKAKVFIRQGAEEKYRPELYVQATEGTNQAQFTEAVKKAMAAVESKYPGVGYNQRGQWCHVAIPDKYRIGHEAHFAQVTERYLRYLVAGALPRWETTNMITKYYITTTALELAKR